MKARIALAGLLLSVFAVLAQAAPQEKINPAKEADIRRLLDLLGTKKLMGQLGAQIVEGIKPAFEKDLPAGERGQQILNTLLQKVQARLNSDELVELTIPIYDKYFTQGEIKGIIQFYESPLGQHFVQVLPQLMQDSYAAGTQWGEKTFQQILQEMQEEFPELKQGKKPAPDGR